MDNAVAPDLVLDLASFQLIRAGRRLKLEKTPLALLAMLARRRGTLVTREEIVTKIWGDAVHIDVDAGINTAIRKIRHALEDDPTSPRYLETVVGKGYRFVGTIEIVESASERPSSGQSAPAPLPIPHKVTNWTHQAAIILGATFLLFLAVLGIRREATSSAVAAHGRIVVAVVPLQNLSEDPGQDYLVDGLTDEILTQLGQLSPERLAVIRYSAFTNERKTISAADVGQKTNSQFMLEGSVRRHQGQARISVRLVRVADATTQWTESFDRPVGDALLLQSEIAQRIGHELQIQTLGRDRTKSVAPEVIEAYLHGRFELSRFEPSETARAYFERALALEPSYVPAYAGLADLYRSRAIRNDQGSEQAWRLADQYATKALSLDPNSAETHAAIAQIKLMHDWDWGAAREHALRALHLNPSLPEAHAVYARYLRIAGNMVGALNQRKQEAAFDPLRRDIKEHLLLEYFFARDYQTIVVLARQDLAVDSNDFSALVNLCNGLGKLKSFDTSVQACSKQLAAEGHRMWVNPYVREYQNHGFEAANLLIAKKRLDEIQHQPKPDLWDLANAYVAAGMKDETIRTLYQGLAIHEPGLLQLRVDPDFDPIRNDPRYAALIQQIGFPNE